MAYVFSVRKYHGKFSSLVRQEMGRGDVLSVLHKNSVNMTEYKSASGEDGAVLPEALLLYIKTAYICFFLRHGHGCQT
jgi:hypothetical protein